METKISRYSTTEYNRWARVRARLEDIYGAARVMHSTHTSICEKVMELQSTNDYKRLKSYYLGMFHGMRDALSKEIYRNYLEWRVFYNGALVLGKDVPDGEWCNVVAEKGAHVWKANPERKY